MRNTSDARVRAKDESFPRFFAKFLLVYAILAGIFGVWSVNAGELRHWWNRTPFDSGTWQAARGAEHTDRRRQAMIDDLIEGDLLAGRSEAEVLALLGEADQVDLDAHRDMLYSLGSRGYSLEWMAVDLGADGKVERVFISRD